MWNGETQLFICSWCGSDYTEQQINELEFFDPEEEKRRIEQGELFADETDVYVCNSCGAEIVCDHNTAASFCYYCHNPVALKGRLSGNYRPEMIIPFQLSKRQAEAAFRANCMRKHFLPVDFLKQSTLDKMTGLYVPFWLCDCYTDASILAEGCETVSHSYNGVSATTKTLYRFDHAVKMVYMGVPADGSMKINDDLMDSIEPYDYRFFREFEMSYLAGYMCDKYDAGIREMFPRIKKRVETAAVDVLKDGVRRYEQLDIIKKKTRVYKTKWRYVLLPVWFMSYKHHGKIYTFAMNGQTGKFSGEFPVSWLKTVGAALLAAFVTGFATYIAMGGGA